MNAIFIEQVQRLVHIQQFRNSQKECVKKSGNYMWLTNKRPTLVWLSSREEYLLLQALRKLNDEDKVKVLNQLIKWIEELPEMSSNRVMEICMMLLGRAVDNDALKTATLSRMASFRKSLRRFSTATNKITPAPINIGLNNSRMGPRRSVTFNDIPTII